jgi:hypothetical protein
MDFTSRNSGDSREGRDKTYFESKTLPDNKSVRSAKSGRKKSEISASTIISSIEREILELLQDISVRAHKNKLLSISEYLKLLSKKFLQSGGNSNIESKRDNLGTSYNPENYKFHRSNSMLIEENSKFKDEIENLKKNYENELRILKEEISNLQSKLSNTGPIVSESVDIKFTKPASTENSAKMTQKLESVNFLLAEEKVKNGHLILQIKNLEEALKTLNQEYNSLSFKFGKLQSECEGLEKNIANMRNNNHESKYKFEDLVKINEDLKKKLIENDNTMKIHNEDIKSILKKNAMQQRYIEELETKLKQIAAELAYKEERLKALRHMNSKLEQKSTQILKKFEAFKLYEEKSNEISQNSQRLMEVIEDLNRKLSIESYEKDTFRKSLESTNSDKNKIISECEDLRKQLLSIKSMNEELMSKNTELENKFKRSLDQRGGDSRDASFILSKERGATKGFHSTTMNSINYTMNLGKEGYSQV